MMPVKAGRRIGGTAKATMQYDPVMTLAAPTLVIARPTISMTLDRETPHRRLPSSKIRILVIKTLFMSKYLYALPQNAWKPETVRKKADPYHPISLSEWNWSYPSSVSVVVYEEHSEDTPVILGMAVVMMVMSRDARNMLSTNATTTARSRKDEGYSSPIPPPSSGMMPCCFSSRESGFSMLESSEVAIVKGFAKLPRISREQGDGSW
jgi:hypothetical protein